VTALEHVRPGGALATPGSHQLSREQVELIKRTIAKGASDDELKLFEMQCNRTGLDPFARQIYCIGRYDSKTRSTVYQTQSSIDGLRLVAERSGRYEGQDPIEWTADGKEWVEAWLSEDPPAAARAAVYKTGFRKPMTAVATWEQYKQTFRKKIGSNPDKYREELSPMWTKMGPLMLGKCAEALAIRKAFPMELSGIYIQEEGYQQSPAEGEGAAPAQSAPPQHRAAPGHAPPEPEPPEDAVVVEPKADDPWTDDQRKHIFAGLRDLKITDKEDALEYVRFHSGKEELQSSKELTYALAETVIAAIEHDRKVMTENVPTVPTDDDEPPAEGEIVASAGTQDQQSFPPGHEPFANVDLND
jgi:phage recombination protein Bet